jgi:hypothetical protein
LAVRLPNEANASPHGMRNRHLFVYEENGYKAGAWRSVGRRRWLAERFM